MTSRDGRKQTKVELPIETRQAMKDEDSAMWQVVDQAVRMYLGMGAESTEAGIERRLEELYNEREGHIDVIQERANRVREIDEIAADLETQLEELREKKATYHEQLDAILEAMQDHPDRNVLAWMSEIRNAAIDEFGNDTSSNLDRVINDLRDRRDEQNLEIPDHRFRKSSGPSPQAGGPAGQPVQADGDGREPDLKVFRDGGDE